MDTIVNDTRANPSDWTVTKPLTKKQATYLKYKDIIVDGKITCEKCNVTVNVMSYDSHLKSAVHAIGKPSTDKFKCECGAELNLRYRDIHYKSKEHIEKMNKLNHRNDSKIEAFIYYKDKVNCCSRCLKFLVPDCYFLKDVNLCICCDEILKGGEKRCRACKELKNINDFERPYLIRCKQCAKKRLQKYSKNKQLCDTIPKSTVHGIDIPEATEWITKIKVKWSH